MAIEANTSNVGDSAREWDVIVLGLGAMGSAALLTLARRGARVLGIEQFTLAHAHGSSHGGSRIVRTAYFEHPDYVPLLRRATAGWRELELASRTRLVHNCGVLYGGLAGSEVIAGVKESARVHGIALESLAAQHVAQRFPAFLGQSEPIEEFLFEPGAGFIRPERAILAMTQVAQHLGAHVRERTRVQRWEESHDSVIVHAGESVERTKQLIICAGPWSPEVAPQLRAPMVNTRQVIGWVTPRAPECADAHMMPAFFMERVGGDPLYGIPMSSDQAMPRGVKIGVHGRGQVCTPENIDRVVREAERVELEGLMQRIAPGAAGAITQSAVCIYTNTPDDHFVIDRLPEFKRVTVAGGFCGHGFKFAPVVGELLADLALDGASALPAGFLRGNRFDRA